MTNQPIDVLISMKIVVAIMIIIISPYLYTPAICGICKPIYVIYKPVLLTPGIPAETAKSFGFSF